MPSTADSSAEERVDCGERRFHLVRRVADQRRQQGGRAEAAMGSNNLANSLRRRRVVEQNVAAAVDLDVNETGNEPDVFRQCPDRDRHGTSSRGTTAAMRSPSIITAALSCRIWPSKTESRGDRVLGSSGARHFLQMSRPIDIGAATRGKPHEERIEALDETDRIGVGVIGRKRRQARGTCRRPGSATSKKAPLRRRSAISSAKPAAASSAGRKIIIG